jgi:MFS family permease
VELGVLLLLFGWSSRILFQPLALDLGLSTQVTGWMYAAFAGASIVGGLAAGYVGAKRRRPVLVGAFLLVLAATAATGAAGPLGPFVFLPLMGFAYMLASTVLEVLTNEVVAPAVRATIFGAVSFIAGVGIAIARPSLGVIADRHSTPFAFGVWAVIGVVLVGLAIRGILRLHRAE